MVSDCRANTICACSRTVEYLKISTISTLMEKSLFICACNLGTSSEFPPKSKKLLSTPTELISKISCHSLLIHTTVLSKVDALAGGCICLPNVNGTGVPKRSLNRQSVFSSVRLVALHSAESARRGRGEVSISSAQLDEWV